MDIAASGAKDGSTPLRPLVRRLGPPLLIGAIFGAALLALHHLAQGLDYQSIAAQIRAFDPSRVFGAILLTFGSFAALMGYDRSALHYVGRQAPAERVDQPPE